MTKAAAEITDQDDSDQDDSDQDDSDQDDSDQDDSDQDEGFFKPKALALMLVPIVPTLIWCLLHERISQRQSHEGRLALAIIALVLIGITSIVGASLGLGFPQRLLTARTTLGRLLIGVWIATASWGVFNYYQFDHRVLTTPGDYADATFYYINSKYFDELGYHRLYEAMLAADDEGPKRFAKVPKYRDLVGYYDILPRGRAIERARKTKSYFTDARWQQFKHDVSWISSRAPVKKRWDYFFKDHGYNPPPSWTLVGGTLSQWCSVENIKWITSIDIVLVLLVFFAIGWAFGGWALLISLLFFLCTFSGRWPTLGQSLLRFDWLSCLVIATCMLKRGLHGWGGGLLTYATLNRIFPGIFGFPYVVWMIKGAYERRKAGEPMLAWRGLRAPAQNDAERSGRFVLGVFTSLVIFGLGAAVVVGPQSYIDAAHNLKMHGSPDSWSSHRVGLGDALVYRFEMDNASIEKNGGMVGKTKDLWAIQPVLKGLGLLSALAIALYIWRRRDPVSQLIWLGMFPLFIMTTPQINYYNLRLLPILLHVELLGKKGGRWHLWPLIWLFLIEVVAQAAMVSRAPRYAVTSLTSVGLAIYLAFMIYAWVRQALSGPAAEQVDTEAEKSGAKAPKEDLAHQG